jgi:hypothetical protein
MITPVQRDAIMNVNGHSSEITRDHYVRRSRRDDVINASIAMAAMGGAGEVEMSELFAIRSNIISSSGEVEMPDSVAISNNIIFSSSSSGDDASAIRADADSSSDDEENAVAVAVAVVGVRSPQRVPWSAEEVEWVGKWCKTNAKESGTSRNIVARCYTYICENENIKNMFHPHHIEDSTRLYYGYKKYNMQL